MSGSPMYSAVGVGAAVQAAQAARRRAQLAERRRREEARARERARLAAQRAAERAARERRDQERIVEARQRARRRAETIGLRRSAERDRRIEAFEEQRRAAVSRSLREVADLITEARGQADPETLFDLDGRLSALRTRLLLSSDATLGAAVEELRGRVVALLRRAAPASESVGRTDQLAELERRLAVIGAVGGGPDAAGRARCEEVLGRLRTALEEGRELRF
ncbi:hypothetical protein J0670_37945, partial [Streptomyces sp. FH025]|nr:hypothetical protein [Streptomyces sp. FH025]